MSIGVALSAARAAAEARMTSRCTIRRRTGARTTDADGMDVEVWVAIHTDLPIRLAGASSGASPVIGRSNHGTQVNHAHRTAHLPFTTSDLADGDLIDITAGDNAGTVWRITESDWQDQATARRVPVETTERPEEW